MLQKYSKYEMMQEQFTLCIISWGSLSMTCKNLCDKTNDKWFKESSKNLWITQAVLKIILFFLIGYPSQCSLFSKSKYQNSQCQIKGFFSQFKKENSQLYL